MDTSVPRGQIAGVATPPCSKSYAQRALAAALLAKGRMLGLQFDTLFTDDLYFRVARHANEMAERLRDIFISHGKKMGVDSPTNQQFVILTPQEKEQLMKSIAFEVWSPLPDGNILCRFVTSWATTEEDLQALDKFLALL